LKKVLDNVKELDILLLEKNTVKEIII